MASARHGARQLGNVTGRRGRGGHGDSIRTRRP